MLVRCLTARVKPGAVGPFNDLLRRQLPVLRQQPGLVYVKLARRLEPDGSEEVILFQEWRNVESLYAWVGKDLDSPHLFGGDDGHIADFRITHYESLDVEPVWFDASSTNGTGVIGAPLGELPEETPR